jgi:anti-sigma factor RsiW
MAPMRCDEFRQISSDWMEGARTPAASSHLAGCARCRALIADLELIRSSSALLPEEEPPARVWTAIKSQLEKEGLIRTPALAPNPSWWQRLSGFGVFRPALAGAYLSAVIAGAVVLGIQMKTTDRAAQQTLWLQHAQTTMTPVAAELSSAETKTVPALSAQDNDVTTTLNHNLAIVDNMISMCEKSVREDPQNEMTRDYLYTAYQQKADLLATMAESAAR